MHSRSVLGGEENVVAAFQRELADDPNLAGMPGPHKRYGLLRSFMIWQEASNHGDQVFLVRDWTEEFGGVLSESSLPSPTVSLLDGINAYPFLPWASCLLTLLYEQEKENVSQ